MFSRATCILIFKLKTSCGQELQRGFSWRLIAAARCFFPLNQGRVLSGGCSMPCHRGLGGSPRYSQSSAPGPHGRVASPRRAGESEFSLSVRWGQCNVDLEVQSAAYVHTCMSRGRSLSLSLSDAERLRAMLRSMQNEAIALQRKSRCTSTSFKT